MILRCATCGEFHELADMQVGYEWPDAYLALPVDERDARCRHHEDLADIDRKTYFVRGVLEIPVRGEPNPFGWGAWARIAEADFKRYLSIFRDDAQGQEPPFRGWLATQLPGYPQTLGLPVDVQLKSATRRPSLVVASSTHPLAVEQQQGIFVERVLELLSPWMHQDTTLPPATPYTAALERDGWTLDDAVERFTRRDGVLWLPSTDQRSAIPIGEYAKLLVRIEASDETGMPTRHVERMWVEVDCIRDAAPRYSGVLTNDPHVPGLCRRGMRIWFGPEHVVDIGYQNETLASESSEVLQCRSHGPSQTTYVCQHLRAGSGLGFHQADDPGNPRPDAWCDACDAVLEEEGEWNERSGAFAKVTVLCGACYDSAETRNRQSLP